MREIKDHEKEREKQVIDAEKQMKGEFTKKKREAQMEQERRNNEMKNKQLKDRMERVHKKVGKPAMPRSQKKVVKKKEEKKVYDQNVEDRKKYVGELAPPEGTEF